MYSYISSPSLWATQDKNLTYIYWLHKYFICVIFYCIFIAYNIFILSSIWDTFISKSYFFWGRFYILTDALQGGRAAGSHVSAWLGQTKVHEPRDCSHSWSAGRAGTGTLVLPKALGGSHMSTGHLMFLPPLPFFPKPRSQQKISCL